MREWGFDIAAETPCRELSVEQLQIVEIARALARGAKCVLLDEPTAALERDAVRRLFERVRQLTEGGVAVLYISHHLEEVFEICQDVAVLRDGELVLSAPTADLSRDDLVAAMVGARAGQASQEAEVTREARAARGDVVLAVDDLTADSAKGRLSGVSLRVHAGEIVGVTGLLSAGVATLGRAIAGAGRPFRRRGAAERAPHPVPAARRRPARGHRLHPGGPPCRGVRRAPGRGRERHDDHHHAAVRPARRAPPGTPGRRGGAAHGQALAGLVRPQPAGQRAVRRQSAEGHRRADARARPGAHRRDHADPRRRRRVEGTAAHIAHRGGGGQRGGRAAVQRRAPRSRDLRPGHRAGPGRGLHRIHRAALRPRRADRRDGRHRQGGQQPNDLEPKPRRRHCPPPGRRHRPRRQLAPRA